MDGGFPGDVCVRIISETSARGGRGSDWRGEDEKRLGGEEAGYGRDESKECDGIGEGGVSDSVQWLRDAERCKKAVVCGAVLLSAVWADNISMLKRCRAMEVDSEECRGEAGGREGEGGGQASKKACGAGPEEGEGSPEGRGAGVGRAEGLRRYSQGGEGGHVTQSRSIFSHEDRFVYGNPKEEIKGIENPPAGEAPGASGPLEGGAPGALDLSCKGPRAEEERPPSDGSTYHNYRSDAFPRSNLEIKLVSPGGKKPSIPEQLQIAKIQQQQRRSMQQQQKLLQQMRRSLDPKAPPRQEPPHKNLKYYANSTTNHEQNDLDNHARLKDDFHPPAPGAPFPQFPYPYFDPTHPKELPDNHPILPLLDPVYFSALYNAHGFLPPSSPSIAAAFIGTLQDALPKLPVMFPSTSSTTSPLLPQKGNDNPN